MKKTSNNNTAVIILHEIYGVNQFIEDICTEYHDMGFDVFYPNMLGREYFPYSEASEAYQFFMDHVGFDYYNEIDALVTQLKDTYDKVFILGFSVGATIAWRCCESSSCDGVICCYGSRIRDFLSLQPSCPTLLFFAAEDTFDVESVIKQLSEKSNVTVYKLEASHGFMDHYSKAFDQEQRQKSKEFIIDFLKNMIEITIK